MQWSLCKQTPPPGAAGREGCAAAHRPGRAAPAVWVSRQGGPCPAGSPGTSPGPPVGPITEGLVLSHDAAPSIRGWSFDRHACMEPAAPTVPPSLPLSSCRLKPARTVCLRRTVAHPQNVTDQAWWKEAFSATMPSQRRRRTGKGSLLVGVGRPAGGAVGLHQPPALAEDVLREVARLANQARPLHCIGVIVPASSEVAITLCNPCRSRCVPYPCRTDM
jgi:hypothetical protein